MAFNTKSLPEEDIGELTLCMNYAILGCQMILANFKSVPLGLPSIAEVSFIRDHVRSETKELLRLNPDLVHERLPPKLIDIIQTPNYKQQEVPATLLNNEIEWKQTDTTWKQNPILIECGYTHQA